LLVSLPFLASAFWYKLYFYDRSVCGFPYDCKRHRVKFVTICNAYVQGYYTGR